MTEIDGNMYLVVSSDSGNSTGNANSFTQVLAEKVILNSNKQYEVSLVDFECPTPSVYANKQIHITADICVMSDINGVYERFAGKSMILVPTQLEQLQLQVINPVETWVRLYKTTFSEVSITIKDSAGVLVPSDGRSSITLCIRQVK